MVTLHSGPSRTQKETGETILCHPCAKWSNTTRRAWTLDLRLAARCRRCLSERHSRHNRNHCGAGPQFPPIGRGGPRLRPRPRSVRD